LQDSVSQRSDQRRAIAMVASIEADPETWPMLGLRDALHGLLGARTRMTDHRQRAVSGDAACPRGLALEIEEAIDLSASGRLRDRR
jgi:hypothetical protein